jgi:prepilin-type N-terminal cleavage/methylation domain-containing protein
MRHADGFTMAEVLVSIVIVSGMFLAALHAAGVSQTSQYRIRLQSQGRLLAEDLASEINALPFQDPGITDSLSSIGHASSEGGDTRALFDDADDYHEWIGDPPQRKDGTVIPAASRLKRSVAVEWVLWNDPNQTTGTKTGLKRFTVTVFIEEAPLTQIQWVRTWERIEPAAVKGQGP